MGARSPKASSRGGQEVPSTCIYGRLQRKKSLKVVVDTSEKIKISYSYVLNLFLKLTRPIYFSLTVYISEIKLLLEALLIYAFASKFNLRRMFSSGETPGINYLRCNRMIIGAIAW